MKRGHETTIHFCHIPQKKTEKKKKRKKREEKEGFYSSFSSPGTYSKLTSKITGLLGATLGLPGAEVRPLGNASWLDIEKTRRKKRC